MTYSDVWLLFLLGIVALSLGVFLLPFVSLMVRITNDPAKVKDDVTGILVCTSVMFGLVLIVVLISVGNTLHGASEKHGKERIQ